MVPDFLLINKQSKISLENTLRSVIGSILKEEIGFPIVVVDRVGKSLLAVIFETWKY